MKAIPREAGRITYSTEIRKLKAKSFTGFQKAVLVGCILGDGNLMPNWSKTNLRLKVEHSLRQRRYLAWKYRILDEWVIQKPRLYRRNQSISFKTISHKEITAIGEQFLQNGKKVIPLNVAEYLRNPITLAVWFMDDGNAIKRNNRVCGYHLNTQSYSRSENLRLIDALKKVCGIDFSLERNKDRFRLRIMKKGFRVKFFKLVKRHMVKSMLYKLGSVSDSP